MGACQNRVRFFQPKRKLSFKQYYLLWQRFSSWKTSWVHFHVMDQASPPEPETGRGSKERSNSTAITRHQDVLLLEPKSFGFSTTIFSIWFLAWTRKKKKFVFIRSPSGKAPHPVPALPAGQASRNMALSLWIFISLGYWGRHLMRLLTETESVRSFEEKHQHSGRFSSHGGVSISVLSRYSGCGRDTSFPRRKISKCPALLWEKQLHPAPVSVTAGSFQSPRSENPQPDTAELQSWFLIESGLPQHVLEFQLRFSWYFGGKWKYMATPALFQT